MLFFLDLDDVISNTYPVILKYAHYFHTNILGKALPINTDAQFAEDYYNIQKKFNWCKNDIYRFFHELYPEFLREAQAITTSVSYIHTLYTAGHYICILSAREERHESIVQDITTLWLNDNKIPYHEVHINCKQKAEYISKYSGPKIYIDDTLSNCITASKLDMCKVFFYTNPYNEGLISACPSNITPISSLLQIDTELFPATITL